MYMMSQIGLWLTVDIIVCRQTLQWLSSRSIAFVYSTGLYYLEMFDEHCRAIHHLHGSYICRVIYFLEKHKPGGKSGASGGGSSGTGLFGGIIKRAQEPKSEELERRKYLEIVVHQLRGVVHADTAGSVLPPASTLHRK